MSSSKKIDQYRYFTAGSYLSEVQNPIHTVYVYIVYLFTQGRGGEIEPEGRLEGQQFTKLGRKYQHD